MFLPQEVSCLSTHRFNASRIYQGEHDGRHIVRLKHNICLFTSVSAGVEGKMMMIGSLSSDGDAGDDA